MNERNVATLERLIWELSTTPSDEAAARELAERLAARGVLAPTALTEDEAVKIGADAAATVPADRNEVALCVREGLEKVARGEG